MTTKCLIAKKGNNEETEIPQVKNGKNPMHPEIH